MSSAIEQEHGADARCRRPIDRADRQSDERRGRQQAKAGAACASAGMTVPPPCRPPSSPADRQPKIGAAEEQQHRRCRDSVYRPSGGAAEPRTPAITAARTSLQQSAAEMIA